MQKTRNKRQRNCTPQSEYGVLCLLLGVLCALCVQWQHPSNRQWPSDAQTTDFFFFFEKEESEAANEKKKPLPIHTIMFGVRCPVGLFNNNNLSNNQYPISDTQCDRTLK